MDAHVVIGGDVPCFNSLAAAQYERANEARVKREGLAAAYLHSEFVNALRTGPQTKISTPGFAKSTWTVADVIADSFAGETGDADLNELLVILNEVSKQSSDVGMRASALIAKMAARHAAFHKGDM